MKRYSIYLVLICSILFVFVSSSAGKAITISGQSKLGYIFIDDDGKLSTTEEMFNLYSGLTLEELILRGSIRESFPFELKLFNINQDNRSLFFSLGKPQLFSLKSRLNQSRFVFDREGKVRFERTFASLSGYLQPVKFLKLKSDFFHHVKKGDRRTFYSDELGALGGEYDQFFWSAGFGGQLKWGKRFLDFEYRLRSLDDEKNDSQDREGSRIRTSLNAPLPQNLLLSLQYLHDENQLKESELGLKSDMYSGSLLYHPLKQMEFSTKVLFQSTENQSTQTTSDILKGSGEVFWRFHKGYRLNLGYEYEKRKDENEGENDEGETVINSYLLGASARFIPELSVRVRYVFQDREDGDRVTLTGPYEDERILVELKTTPVRELNLRLRYRDKRRDNPDISSSVHDKGFIFSLTLTVKEWLGFDFSGSLLKAEYDNTAGEFKTENQTFCPQINLKPFEKLKLTGGWNHIDVGGDLDIQKEGVWLGFDYALMEDYSLQGRYNVYDYDDYLYLQENYVANVYTLSLVKKFGGL